jgi:WD repeat-containing protein 34
MAGSVLSEDNFKSGEGLQQFRRADEDSFRFEAHVGRVRLSFSPFHRSLFLSAGEDGVAKLFHVLRGRPLREWEPSSRSVLTGISAACFSPVRPTVFALATITGSMLIFDLSQSLSSPIATVEAPLQTVHTSGAGARRSIKEEQHRSPLIDIAFNFKQRDMIAACDAAGRVHV